MLNGVLTGLMPETPSIEGEVVSGRGTYQAVLTPKGRMISDLWAYRLGDTDTEVYLLDVPVAGVAGLLDHFGRFLPPRFAAVNDVSAATASISVVGPGSVSVLTRLALGLRVEPTVLEAATEGDWFVSGAPTVGDRAELTGLLVTRTAEVWPDAWTVYGPVDAVRALWSALVSDGATPAGLGVWATLRVEAGRPVFGTDMDEKTLPPEAGIVDRAIDQTKGCYTGQEVIVRIRDRGHVNRHLRVHELGDVPAPALGAELLSADGAGKVVGQLTSVVQSPRAQGVLAMGYVRRGVTEVLLGDRRVTVPSS
jgi:folate-binding protein YgfZ